MPSKVCAQRKGSMMVYGSDVNEGLRVIRSESVVNKRRHGKLVRLDAKHKSTLRRGLGIQANNVMVSVKTYKEYRTQRVTVLTDVEKEREQVRILTEGGFIERRTLSRAAKRLKAKELSVK